MLIIPEPITVPQARPRSSATLGGGESLLPKLSDWKEGKGRLHLRNCRYYRQEEGDWRLPRSKTTNVHCGWYLHSPWSLAETQSGSGHCLRELSALTEPAQVREVQVMAGSSFPQLLPPGFPSSFPTHSVFLVFINLLLLFLVVTLFLCG